MSNKLKRAVRAGKPLYLAIATALFSASAGIAAAPVEKGDHYLVVPAGSYDRLEAGRQLMHDYGPFQLWRMDGGHAAEIRSAGGKDVQPVDSAILFEAGAFDPPNQRFALPALNGFDLDKPTGHSIELVQFVGPIADAWEKQLSATGVKVLQYIPNNAYAVLADAQGRAALSEFQRSNAVVRLAETLQPIYKLNGALAQRARAGLSPSAEIDVSIVLARHSDNAASKAAIAALQRGNVHSEWGSFAAFETISLRVRESDIETLAGLADVFAVEDYHPPVLLDESQNQILAGSFNPTFTGPSAPGYLAWLTGQGFSTNPADYPIVAVVDDGIGNGTTTLGAGDVTLTQNSANTISRVMFTTNCTADPLADGRAGHGHINSSIIGGFDSRGDAAGIQFPFEDPNGYLRGQGVNPWGRVGNTKFFNNAGSGVLTNCGGSFVTQIQSQHAGGARISSNSWGAAVSGDYNANSATFDAATRDADTTLAGMQPMIFLIAAGNQGSGASTIGSPATGKNVITVGASENARPDYSDACDDDTTPPTTDADNAMDVIDFSSRGPAEGSRIKPELIAPGTHIQGTASTAVGYDGTGVCAQFVPPGQFDFASSSGTSHSTPALAGVTSLVYRYLQTAYGITPSGAMAKAYLMAHPTYLTGVAGNGNLPTNSQGFGMPNLRLAFDATTGRVLRDQQDPIDNTGQIVTFNQAVADTAKPLRIALSWSDAPGATSGDPKVNNLNLEVDVGGNTFRGNVFTGQTSTTGGTADANNNYEAVYLPAGTSGPIQIRVIGANIAGDGIPGSGDATDQDFALVCSNCVQQPDFTIAAPAVDASTCGAEGASWAVSATPVGGFAGTVNLSATSVPAGGTPSFVPTSGTPPFNSTFSLSTGGIASGLYLIGVNGSDGVLNRGTTVTLRHDASAPGATTLSSPADGTTGVLGAPNLQWNAIPGVSSYVVELDNDSGFGSIDYTATVSGTSHTPAFTPAALTQYFWRVRGSNLCGPGAISDVRSFTTAEAYCVSPMVAIPDNNATGVSSNIVVPAGTALTDLNVLFEARHTWIGDVSATLSRNAGPGRILIDRPGFTGTGFGCNGDNPNIVLDDEGTGAVETTCTNTNPGYPIGASRIPNEALSVFDGQGLAATWTLTVRDGAGGDTGFLDRWCLIPTTVPAGPVDAVNDSFPVTEDVQLNEPAPGVLGNDTPAGLTATLVTPPVNGNLTLNGDGSFSYLPASNACGAAETFTYQASNGVTNDNAVATLNISCVNDAPVAVNDAYNGTEDMPLVVAQAQGVLINDTDVESNPLTAVSASDPANGSVVLNANGSFTYTPDANYCSATPDTFTYSANDGSVNSVAPATVSVTVACVNDNPTVATPIADRSDAEGAVINTSIASAFADVDAGQTLTFSADVLPAGLSMSTAGVITGTISFTANAGSPYTVTVTADDGNGGTVTDTFVWAATNTNQAPTVATPIADRSDAEGAAINTSIASAFADADVGATLTFSADVLPAGLSMSTAGAITGTIAFTANASSPYTVTVTADDGNGGTVTDTFEWTVTNTNQAPTVATPIADRSDAEGAAINTSIASAFADADVGATLTFSADVLPAGLSMSTAGAITGTIAFTANASSPYTVTVTADDGNGGTVTDTFEWTVTNTNQAPTVATPIADRSDAEGAAINTSIASAFADADVGATLTFSADVLPTGLSMNAAGQITGTIDFTANTGSPYTVTVTADDGNGGTITDTFIWTVTDVPQNQAPVVNDQGFNVTVGSANGSVVGTIVTTDPDVGDTRTIAVTGGTGQALFAVNATSGEITVANSAGLVADASLTLNVTVTDVGGLTDTAVITITVRGTRVFANGFEG